MLVDNMEIEIIKDKTLELEMIIHGENHSMCNVLRKYLMEDSDVEYAVYGIDHPLTGEPIMTIKTKRTKRPKNSLLKAANRLKDEVAEFKSLVEETMD
ncbi:MAG: DNA-directed RNA polymerase subunit L [archaeon]|nr:DNA-directed RNA polymerase subunit L [archaeon]